MSKLSDQFERGLIELGLAEKIDFEDLAYGDDYWTDIHGNTWRIFEGKLDEFTAYRLGSAENTVEKIKALDKKIDDIKRTLR